MRRKFLLVVTLVMVASLIAFAPATALEKTSLSVNGEAAGLFDIYSENGITMMPVDVFARVAGADVNRGAGTGLSIIENGVVVNLVVGNTAAEVEGRTVEMPAAPMEMDNRVYVPLRFICESFGFDVQWDSEQRMVLLNREELRDGLSAVDLVVKSDAATREVNTYDMQGTMKMDMTVKEGNQEAQQAQMDMRMEGQIQQEPLQIYIKQTIVPTAGAGIPEMVVETYMTAEKMYMKMPEQGWLVQDMPFGPEFLKQQQDIQSDPLSAAKQIREMGMFLNYGNDVQIDGQDYYVVNATIDMEKFKQGFPKVLEQVTQSLPQPDAGQTPEQMQQTLQQLIENMEMNYFYTVLINKETLITDVIKIDAVMKLRMDVPVDGHEGASPVMQQVRVDIDMSGDFKITGLGEPFAAPDVSDAIDMTAALSKPN